MFCLFVIPFKAAALTDAERVYQNMCAGVTSSADAEEEAGTLTDQVSNAKKAAAMADEAVKQGQMTAKHLGESVKGLRKDLKVDGDGGGAAARTQAAAAFFVDVVIVVVNMVPAAAAFACSASTCVRVMPLT